MGTLAGPRNAAGGLGARRASRLHSGSVLVASVENDALSTLLRQYQTVFFLVLVGCGLVGLMLGVSWLLRPSKRTGDKHVTYESGVNPVGSTWSQTQIRYYLFALLFVMFDVEAVFIFPWATRLEAYGMFGLIEMGVFIGILLLGLLYAWRKGVLRWV